MIISVDCFLCYIFPGESKKMANDTILFSDYVIFEGEVRGQGFDVQVNAGELVFSAGDGSVNSFLDNAVSALEGNVVRNGTIDSNALEHFGNNTNPSINLNGNEVTIGGAGVGGSFRAAFDNTESANEFKAFADDLLGSDPSTSKIFEFDGLTNGGVNRIDIHLNDEIVELNRNELGYSGGLRTVDSLEFKWSGAGVQGIQTTNNLDVFIEEMGSLFSGNQIRDGRVDGFGTQNQAKLIGDELDRVTLGSRGVGGSEIWEFSNQSEAQNFLNFFRGVVGALDSAA
jgi:hypothetical protein